MPPEYVTCGHFSTKSDVYSFGVLILEIVCGKKNSSFYHIDDDSGGNMVTHVRKNQIKILIYFNCDHLLNMSCLTRFGGFGTMKHI